MPAFTAIAEQPLVEALVRRGRELRGPSYFILRIRISAAPQHGAVIVTPKKIFRHAVDRNRAARRCRALLRAELPASPPAYDLAVLPKVALLRAPYRALQEELRGLLTRIAA